MNVYMRKYNTATAAGTHIRVPILKAGSPEEYATGSDWTPAAGDVKISKDGGAQANIGTLPTYSNGAWQFQLTAAELQAKTVEIAIVDSATKAIVDDFIIVETFGNASAMYPYDLSDSVRLGLTALPNAAPDAAGGLPVSDAGGLDMDTLLGRLDATVSSRGTADPGDEMNLADDAIGAGKFDQSTAHPLASADSGATEVARTGADGDTLETLSDEIESVDANVDILVARLTAARAGYLDNLIVASLVASQADVAAITQAQRVRISLPAALERPDSGSTNYRIWIYAYDAQHQAEDLDSNPTVTAENNVGTDRSGNLGSVTKPGGTTGQYYVDYTIADSHAIEGLIFKVDATEGAVTTQYSAASIVVDTTAVDFTAADRTKLEAVFDKLPSKDYLRGTADADGGLDSEDKADIQAAAAAALTAYDAATGADVSGAHATTDALISSLNNLSQVETQAAAAAALAAYDAATGADVTGAHATTDGLINGLNDLSSAEAQAAASAALSAYDPPTSAELAATQAAILAAIAGLNDPSTTQIAAAILANPANLIYTDSNGRVRLAADALRLLIPGENTAATTSASSFEEKVNALYERFIGKHDFERTGDTGAIHTYKEDDSLRTTQAATDDGTTQTVGAAT